jgi:NADPH-dependent curcumin reductase CurA
MVQNETVIFAEIPSGVPVPGETTKKITNDIDPDKVNLEGGVLVKVAAVSLDPWLRDRMRNPAIKSYNDAFLVGNPLESHLVGKVVRSESSNWKESDTIYGIGPHSTYFVVPDNKLIEFTKISPLEGVPLRTYTGAVRVSTWATTSSLVQSADLFVFSAGWYERPYRLPRYEPRPRPARRNHVW